jgi:prepilin-type N-terminal cleavage/methylation domain-containing protein
MKKRNYGFTPLENRGEILTNNALGIDSGRDTRKKSRFLTGFTLIELLIVVAIIAILAAIAIPNFLSAQTRSKVAKAKSEMRTLATGLESYYTDYNCYVGYRWISNPKTDSKRFIPLTTPVAYITRVPKPDPFQTGSYNVLPEYDTYDYFDEQYFIEVYPIATAMAAWGGHTWGRSWRMSSAGPDLKQDYAKSYDSPWNTWRAYSGPGQPGWPNYYDPSNGTISNGDIIRFGGPGKLSFGAGIANDIINN